jgi:hypothetical protein
MPLKQREHSAHNRDRSSAFLAANSSGARMPFCCSSASRSMLANMPISWAVSAWWGSTFGEAGGRRHPSASPGAPSTDTMGKLERLSSPPSRKAGSSPRGGSGSRESVPRFSSSAGMRGRPSCLPCSTARLSPALRRKKRGGKSRRAGPTVRRGAHGRPNAPEP